MDKVKEDTESPGNKYLINHRRTTHIYTCIMVLDFPEFIQLTVKNTHSGDSSTPSYSKNLTEA